MRHGAFLWMDRHWLGAGMVLLVALLFLLPLVIMRFSGAEMISVLALILYLIHQIEEHVGDRFRFYINETMGDGQMLLSPRGVMLINVVLVWLVFGISMLATAFYAEESALVPVYLMLVNAVVHSAFAAKRREVNPGLYSAVSLFLPFCLASLWWFGPLPTAHWVALGLAVLGHIGIIIPLALKKFGWLR